MWKKIREFIFIDKTPNIVLYNQDEESLDEVAKAALAHYCRICDKGFKTRGARNSHNSLKHKDVKFGLSTTEDHNPK